MRGWGFQAPRVDSGRGLLCDSDWCSRLQPKSQSIPWMGVGGSRAYWDAEGHHNAPKQLD